MGRMAADGGMAKAQRMIARGAGLEMSLTDRGRKHYKLDEISA